MRRARAITASAFVLSAVAIAGPTAVSPASPPPAVLRAVGEGFRVEVRSLRH